MFCGQNTELFGVKLDAKSNNLSVLKGYEIMTIKHITYFHNFNILDNPPLPDIT